MSETNTLLAEFLRARRAAVTPESVGLSTVGYRRVPGLRREELALLAGVSVEYLTRLEQGRDRRPSLQVIAALSEPLGLDDVARQHLLHLAGLTSFRRYRPREETVSTGVLELLETLGCQPALVIGRYRDVLAANSLATALCPAFTPGRNILRYIFLDHAAQTVYGNWDEVALESTRTLRAAVGEAIDDAAFTDLIGELSIKSEAFRRFWGRQEVREKTIGVKRFEHPQIGAISLRYESLTINGTYGQTLSVYSAERGSPDEQSLSLLQKSINDAGRSPTEHVSHTQ